MDNLLLFGGTFDPIHNGHLHTAIAVQQFFHFDQFCFLPCKNPVLNKPNQATSAKHRLKMIQIALKSQPKDFHFTIDSREIMRESPSYMVTTLEDLRLEYGTAFPITLLLGHDVFCQLPQWHQWQRLMQLTNLLVINRKGYEEREIPTEVQTLLHRDETSDPKALLSIAHGLIYRFDAGAYDISSSAVRDNLANKTWPENMLPREVEMYIAKNKLY